MKKKLFYLSVLILLVVPSYTLAAGYQCIGVSAVSGNTGCDATAFQNAIKNITSTLFYVIGAISVIFLLIGAIRYITSTGDATRIKQAKDTIFYALAGVIIAIVAQALIAFVISRIS